MNFGEFAALTISGLIVQLAGIILTAWLTHKKLMEHVNRRTAQQDGTIAELNKEQTVHIKHMTDQQTAVLLGKRRFRRSRDCGPS